MKSEIKSVKSILQKNDFLERITKRSQYIRTEHQDFGIRLSGRLGDSMHKALYMKLAKDLPRSVMESAAQFAIDYPDKSGTSNKGKIFMWKLKELCNEKQIKIPATKRKLTIKKQISKIQTRLFK